MGGPQKWNGISNGLAVTCFSTGGKLDTTSYGLFSIAIQTVQVRNHQRRAWQGLKSMRQSRCQSPKTDLSDPIIPPIEVTVNGNDHG